MSAERSIVNIPYAPRPLQAEIHRSIARVRSPDRVNISVLAIHRRFGKSVCAVAECINTVLSCPHKKPQVFYIAPTYKQAKSIAWEYVKEFTRPIPGMQHKESELTAIFPNGGKIVLVGAENYDSIRGNYIDLCVMDEFGLMSPQAYREVIRPCLSDRLGSALILGTPAGKNHFYDIYQEALKNQEANTGWIARTYRADETHILPQAELDAARATMGEEAYRQEYLCDWAAAVRGSYYALEMERTRKEGKITNVPHAKILPVDVAFDLGMDDATAIWFVQCVGQEIRLIDYQEFSNTSLQDILIQLSREPYVYGTAILPHDAQVRELSTGRTRVQTFEECALFQSVEVTPRIKIGDGINAVRQLFPQLYFDQSRTLKGVDCLENYRKQYDPKTGEFKENPVHDKFSHGADAMRYLAVHYHPTMGDYRHRALGRSNSFAPPVNRFHHVRRYGAN